MYEWGVHMAGFAEAAGFGQEQATLTAVGDPDDPGHPAWSAHRTRTAPLRAVDELHATARLSDEARSGPREYLDEDEQEAPELLVLAGWYRTIAYVANGARIEPEPWALALPES
ncbi:hypothetical protein ACFVGN_23265 [Streptomyces sp. NPDC057757]|uniref:hypothetical protein n=1 Tax=Streptomyces sp. NPDC057757 TaxID=3346241 RepID=UPI0036BFD39C